MTTTQLCQMYNRAIDIKQFCINRIANSSSFFNKKYLEEKFEITGYQLEIIIKLCSNVGSLFEETQPNLIHIK